MAGLDSLDYVTSRMMRNPKQKITNVGKNQVPIVLKKCGKRFSGLHQKTNAAWKKL